MPTPSGNRTFAEIKTSRKMRWWYESLADYMLAHPTASHVEMGAHFKRTTATIGMVINSDAFRAYFRQRRDQHAEILDTKVRAKMFNVADKSMDLILENLDKKRDTIPLELLQRVNESALKTLGYGVDRNPQTVVQVNNTPTQLVPVAVSIEDLERARAALRRSQMQSIEGPGLPGARQIEGTLTTQSDEAAE